MESWESGKEWPNDCFSALPADGLTPLYTAPPTRRPLTLEEIMDAVRDADLDWHTGWSLGDDAPNRFITLIRAAERAHGIGGNDE